MHHIEHIYFISSLYSNTDNAPVARYVPEHRAKVSWLLVLEPRYCPNLNIGETGKLPGQQYAYACIFELLIGLVRGGCAPRDMG